MWYNKTILFLCGKFMHKDCERILIDEDELKKICKRLGKQISDDFRDSDKKLLIVCILKGSLIFTADLMREIDIPCEVDFMKASSYGDRTISNGTVHISLDLKKQDLSDYNIVIMEDILDTGNTMYHLINVLEGRGCDTIKLCVLLDNFYRFLFLPMLNNNQQEQILNCRYSNE